MASLYQENFNTYPIGSGLTSNPPNYVTFVQSSGTWSVQNSINLGRPAANVDTDLWSATVYSGTIFSTASNFIYTASMDAQKQASLVWNIQNLTLDGNTNVGCYLFQVKNNGDGTQQYNLFKDWQGGVGGVTTLSGIIATGVVPGFNPHNFIPRVIQNGSAIQCYCNGINIFNATDTSYTSGRIGFQTLTDNFYVTNASILTSLPYGRNQSIIIIA